MTSNKLTFLTCETQADDIKVLSPGLNCSTQRRYAVTYGAVADINISAFPVFFIQLSAKLEKIRNERSARSSPKVVLELMF